MAPLGWPAASLEGTCSLLRSSFRRRVAGLVAAFAAAALLPMASAAPASAETIQAHVSYLSQDGWGNTQYDVRFNATVSPEGPSRYTIEGGAGRLLLVRDCDPPVGRFRLPQLERDLTLPEPEVTPP